MAWYARVLDGVVQEPAVDLPAGDLPSKYFSASLPGTWEAAPDGSPQSGWTWANNVFSAPGENLAGAQSASTAAAQAHYNALIAAGYTYDGHLYQIDAASQANITAMGALAQGVVIGATGAPAWPDGFGWVSGDNTLVPMTAAQMYAFAGAIAGYVSSCILNLRSTKTAIAAAATVAAVEAIDVTAGYPPATA